MIDLSWTFDTHLQVSLKFNQTLSYRVWVKLKYPNAYFGWTEY